MESSKKISQSNSSQINLMKTISATTVNSDENLGSKVSQNEDTFKGVEIETKPAEEIYGIEIYKTESGLNHLKKKDPTRLAFKQNVKEMNDTLQKVKNSIKKTIEKKEKELNKKLEDATKKLNDTSYEYNKLEFERKKATLKIITLAKTYKSIKKLQEKTEVAEEIRKVTQEVKAAYTAQLEAINLVKEASDNLDKIKNAVIIAAKIISLPEISDSSYMPDTTAFEFCEYMKLLKSDSGKEFDDSFKDFNVEDLQQKVDFNEDYKTKRMEAKKEIINKNKENFGNKYTDLNYKEKAENPSYFFSDNGFYSKEIEVNGVKKKLLRRKYSSADEQLKQFDEGQERLKQAKESFSEFKTRFNESNLGANEGQRADMVTDEGKRAYGPGIKRKDMKLYNLEFRGEDEDGKAVINVPKIGNAKLNIGVNTLTQLFPYNDERTMSPIQQTGDCYLVNCFVQFMKDPENRVDIYKCFTTSDDGKTLKVKYPGGKVELTYNLDKDGQIKDFKKSEKGLDGSLGFQILEELQACEMALSSCKTEQEKQDVINILQQTDKNIDARLNDICDKGIKRDGQDKSENQSAFSYFIDGGMPEVIKKLMNYDKNVNPDEILLEDVTAFETKGNFMGRLLSKHAQAIVDTRHYGVIVEEPNSSNKQGFVSFDNITSKNRNLYTEQLLRAFGRDGLDKLRDENIDVISKELKSKGFEEQMKSSINKENEKLEFEVMLASTLLNEENEADEFAENLKETKEKNEYNQKKLSKLKLIECEYKKEEYSAKLKLNEIGNEEYSAKIQKIKNEEKEYLTKLEQMSKDEYMKMEKDIKSIICPNESEKVLADMELDIYGVNFKRKESSNFKELDI